MAEKEPKTKTKLYVVFCYNNHESRVPILDEIYSNIKGAQKQCGRLRVKGYSNPFIRIRILQEEKQNAK